MNKFSSVFGQILQVFSKSEFYAAVRETGAERRTKGFSSWEQFVAMLFCQMGQAHSLREISGGLATVFGKLKHLGIDSAPSRSTLAYANANGLAAIRKVVLCAISQMPGFSAGQEKVQVQEQAVQPGLYDH